MASSSVSPSAKTAKRTFVASVPRLTDGLHQYSELPGWSPQTCQQTVWTDGAARNNGGEDCECRYAIYWGRPDHPDNASGRPDGPQSNQAAELAAILAAVQVVEARPLCRRPVTLLIVTDSQWAINCLTTWHISWRKRRWTKSDGTSPAHIDKIRGILDALQRLSLAGTRIALQHVTAHCPIPTSVEEKIEILWRGNKAVDEMAARALGASE